MFIFRRFFRRKHLHIDLTEGSIRKHLFNLSYPMALGIMALMTFNLVDTFFISFLGEEALAAIGFTFPIVMIMIGTFIGLGVGNNVLVSRAFGMHNHNKAARYITDGIALSLLIVIVMSSLGVFFMKDIFHFMGVPEELMGMVSSYMFPWFLGLAFMGLPIMTDKSLSAMGDTKTPAKIMIISSIINIILDPLLIFGIGPFPEMGIAGASWATVIGRVFGTFAILYVLNKRNLISIIPDKFLKEMFKSWKDMLKISVPTSINTILVQFIIMMFNKVMAGYGLALIAGFGVAVKIEAFAAIALLAVGESMPAFIGQNFGARRHKRIVSALNYNAYFAIIWSVLCLAIYHCFGELIISIFTRDEIIVRFAIIYLILTSASYSGVELMYASHSLFNSIDKSRYSVFFSVFQTVSIIASIYLGSHLYGAIGGILGLVLSRIVVGYLEFFYAKILLMQDADTERFPYIKPHFIKLYVLKKFRKIFY
ncbi:MAG: MATE family efflux transporter [Alphaproteobacteria bacterium]|nr:MATE family efflux transporter [Alphaproteobacteria bacterium]